MTERSLQQSFSCKEEITFYLVNLLHMVVALMGIVDSRAHIKIQETIQKITCSNYLGVRFAQE